YYRCRTVKNSVGVCNNTHSIRQIDLEDLILKELHKMSETYFDENEIKLQKKRDSQNRLSTLQEEKRQIENKIAKLQNDSVQLYKDKLSGIVSDEQFKIFSDSFNSELSNYNERLELIEKECIGLSTEKKTTLSREMILEKYKNIDKLTFELVHELIDKVYVGALNLETKEREIDIHWKF
ncbi:MAG: DUF4368 domain-containing protein, partial [Hominilimicola sp.]